MKGTNKKFVVTVSVPNSMPISDGELLAYIRDAIKSYKNYSAYPGREIFYLDRRAFTVRPIKDK